jgi:hypothetical protein
MFFYGMVNWTYTWYRATGPIKPAEISGRMADLFLEGFLKLTPADGQPRQRRTAKS